MVDEKRLAVSFIDSVCDGFGSCVVTPRTGIALQNRRACFVTDPAHPNASQPSSARSTPSSPPWLKKDGRIDIASA